MSLIQWDGRDPFAEFDEMFRRFPTMPSAMSVQKSFVPALDIYEDSKNVIIEAPLAGIRPEDVEVSVEKGVLTIKGETRREHEVDDKNYYRKEVRGGSFYREVSLPVAVMDEKVTAEFENGVLKIKAPKAEPKTAKKVQIKIGKNNSKK